MYFIEIYKNMTHSVAHLHIPLGSCFISSIHFGFNAVFTLWLVFFLAIPLFTQFHLIRPFRALSILHFLQLLFSSSPYPFRSSSSPSSSSLSSSSGSFLPTIHSWSRSSSLPYAVMADGQPRGCGWHSGVGMRGTGPGRSSPNALLKPVLYTMSSL